MAQNITDIGAVREQGVQGLSQFIFIHKGTLLILGLSVISARPESDIRDVAAGETSFDMGAAYMNQVAPPARPCSGFPCGSTHRCTDERRPMRAIRFRVKRL